MKLSKSEREVLILYLNELLASEQVQKMKTYIQHGNTSTYTHSLVVAYYSYLFALRLPLRYDVQSIVRGAMLHDFYLYDWHIRAQSQRLHGFVHPRIALKNAHQYFRLNPIEEDIIAKHMWPLNILMPPRFRESMLICLVDKFCSFAEIFHIPLFQRVLE